MLKRASNDYLTFYHSICNDFFNTAFLLFQTILLHHVSRVSLVNLSFIVYFYLFIPIIRPAIRQLLMYYDFR